jgi:hypothetical protein
LRPLLIHTLLQTNRVQQEFMSLGKKIGDEL